MLHGVVLEDVAVFGNSDHEFTFLARLCDPFANLGSGAAVNRFVEFGQFAAYANGAVRTECFNEIIHTFGDTVAGFVKDDRVFKILILIKKAEACGAFGREESDKEKAIAGEPGKGEGGDGGAGTGYGGDGEPQLATGAHQAKTGVADCGGSGIGNKDDFLTPRDPLRERLREVFFVFVAVGEEFGLGINAELCEEFTGYAGVLAGDAIRLRQGFLRTG